MATPRERFEEHHARYLAPCAVTEADSGGRAVAEPDHDYRTCFQRDRDRIVHCSAFRRLDFKTQVFVPHECDHFRTRMTHTLEVSQIARSLARALRLNEDVCEAAALAHDLGHPPFGHAGEAVLNDLMRDHGGFEHNRQSLRVVDYLEHPYPAFRGLNLTQVVRECLARHETAYDTPVCREFDPALQAPLEGQLVDLADEIAYTSADLEDALAAGWITIEQVAGLPLWRRAWSAATDIAPDARPIHMRIRACKAVLATLADDLVRATAANLRAMSIDSLDNVRTAPGKCVALSAQTAEHLRGMQTFLYDHVYLAPPSARQAEQSGKLIRTLFEAYAADPDLLPPRYRQRIDAQGLHRVACDYIAGMTDRFCRQAHAAIVSQ